MVDPINWDTLEDTRVDSSVVAVILEEFGVLSASNVIAEVTSHPRLPPW